MPKKALHLLAQRMKRHSEKLLNPMHLTFIAGAMNGFVFRILLFIILMYSISLREHFFIGVD
jgi:hypothetical protein